MPSIVLLMRSRFKIRPFSFSMRMPSSSSYWRLILRRPASSFGRSSWPSSVCCSSSSRMLNALLLLLLVALSLLRARAIGQNPPSTRPLAVAAALLAHPEEAARPEAGELDHSRLGAAAGTAAALPGLPALLRGLRLLLRHVPPARLWLRDPRPRQGCAPGSSSVYERPAALSRLPATLRRQNSRASVRPFAPCASIFARSAGPSRSAGLAGSGRCSPSSASCRVPPW